MSRPAGTGSKGSGPPGPNSGRKWVHRSEVGASAGVSATASMSGGSEGGESALVGETGCNCETGCDCTVIYRAALYCSVQYLLSSGLLFIADNFQLHTDPDPAHSPNHHCRRQCSCRCVEDSDHWTAGKQLRALVTNRNVNRLVSVCLSEWG